MTEMLCHVERRGAQLELHSPAFSYALDITSGLRAVAWLNRLTGRRITLGRGAELELDFDRAEQRIAITGWRGMLSEQGQPTPDDERGYREGFFSPTFDDSAWRGMLSPAQPWSFFNGDPGARYYWARTHVFLPPACAAKELALVLGGIGLFDYRFMRVFVNGHPIGTRQAAARWNEPGMFDLGPATEAHRYLRFGQDNVIAVQLAGHHTRIARLDELDPLRGRGFFLGVWPAQFEQYLVVGQALTRPNLHVADVSVQREGATGEALIVLRAEDETIAARVSYRWSAADPALYKTVELVNTTGRELRLLNVRLGDYQTDTSLSDGEQGFPVYLGDDRFMTLAHPSGWAIGQHGRVSLRQYPGRRLSPAEAFQSMEAVLGVAQAGEARQAFLAHVRSRMRRVVRGHDRPFAIFEGFGSWEYDPASAPGPFAEVVSQEASDAVLLDNLRELVRGQTAAGYQFDFYSLEFWVDYHGDLTRFDPVRFPEGLANIKAELAKIGAVPGLWIPTSSAVWSIGGNPVVAPTSTHDRSYITEVGEMCRASEPIKTMYSSGFRYHIEENGVRLLKFDGFSAICYNPNHDHLPGVYSTEAIQSAVIETLRELDAACPDLFLMLYWGYRSPWWLLHADTLFEPGIFLEGAHPGSAPTLYVRDSVTQGLDQAQWWCEDVPRLGKDSLGVWLSDWKWNSSIGKERWQEAFVMDMCRGSLLAQPWSDGPWLSPPERGQIAEFIALLRQHPRCFANPQFILGNPWKNEPYGYCCSDGQRAFIALNNCTWSDAALSLELGPAWGLPAERAWDVYRWYPEPARLVGERDHFDRPITLSLRPFAVVLLEVVAPGEAPSLGRRFEAQPLPTRFVEPSRQVPLALAQPSEARPQRVPREHDRDAVDLPPKRVLHVTGKLPACANGGTLAITAELRRGAAAEVLDNAGAYFAAQCSLGGEQVACMPVVGSHTYPLPWQAWRIAVTPSDDARDFALDITAMLPDEVAVVSSGHFIPT
jgi:hypothetical protein